MQPRLSFDAQLAEETAWYEQVRRREIKPISNLAHIGRMLIALRIANGMSQKELADRLGRVNLRCRGMSTMSITI